VKLVPFSPQHLRLGEPLPFGLRDGTGRLLLAAGMVVGTEDRMAELLKESLFSDEAESADWNRRLAAAMDAAIRQGAALRDVVSARPEAVSKDAPTSAPLTLAEQWEEVVMHLDATLRDVRAGSDWRARLIALHVRVRQQSQRRPDAPLYYLVYEAAHSTAKYSAHHALLVMLICEHAAAMLGWPQAWIDSLGRAALTMNVAMLRLQDQLAATHLALTPDTRAEIAAHPAAGERLLAASGMPDPLALATVRLHHDASEADCPLSDLPPERQLARLLRRVDIFAAKISRRAMRQPMSPVQAAREACLGAQGVPDEIGGALLKAVGLYPPGCFVELASGDIGIVVARGRAANLPFVATLIAASGNPLGEPALRDTVDRRYAVKGSVAPGAVKVRPPHDRLMALR
jgi:HD-GYP domain-containing protein (c-di-GMP phosphodiesterase class II)